MMKKFFVILFIAAITFALNITAMAAEKTESFNKLMNTIVSKVDSEVPGVYMLMDSQGNIWEADFADNGNIVCMSAMFDDYETAHETANKLGVSYSYTIPFTKNLDRPYKYDIVVPVYKNATVNVICARPAYLYPSECKTINSFTLTDRDVIVFATRTTASFKANISCGGISADHLWGQDWYAEEFEEEQNSSYNYNDVLVKERIQDLILGENATDYITPDDITDSWEGIDAEDIQRYSESGNVITFDIPEVSNYGSTYSFDAVGEMQRYLEEQSQKNK